MPVLTVDRSPTDAFREQYRQRIPRWYSGWFHFAATSVGSLAVVTACLSRVRHPTAAQWLTVPLTFLAANLIEYLGHRGPMHRRGRPTGTSSRASMVL